MKNYLIYLKGNNTPVSVVSAEDFRVIFNNAIGFHDPVINTTYATFATDDISAIFEDHREVL